MAARERNGETLSRDVAGGILIKCELAVVQQRRCRERRSLPHTVRVPTLQGDLWRHGQTGSTPEHRPRPAAA